MPINLEDRDSVRQRWLPMGGALHGVELLIKHASPRDAEKFRQRLVRQGVLRSGKQDGWNIANGREDDFFRMFAEFYVIDWKGDIKPEGTDYDPQKMGWVLGDSQDAFRQVSESIADDQGFFDETNGGRPSKS